MYAPFRQGEKEVLEFGFTSTNMGKATETKTVYCCLGEGEKKKHILKNIHPLPVRISSGKLSKGAKTLGLFWKPMRLRPVTGS